MTFWDFANAHAEGIGMLIFGCVGITGFFVFLRALTRGPR